MSPTMLRQGLPLAAVYFIGTAIGLQGRRDV